ncbi:MAG: peroxiredoxin family protein [Bryobacteraceae bacterium]
MSIWKPRRMLGTGDQAPKFELEDLTGKRFRLDEELSRGPLLLAFFKVDCPVCQFTFPFLERIHRNAASAIRIYGVSQEGPRPTEQFNREYGVSFPTLLDESRRGYPVSNAFGISVVPTAFLIEPDGTISWVMESFRKKELEELGQRVGTRTFQPGERVPDYRPG